MVCLDLFKWFIDKLGPDGLAKLVLDKDDKTAYARTIFGYAKNENEIKYYEGLVKGKIVSPRGTNGFGYDSIFQPDDSDKTLAEMEPEEKEKFSMRIKALKLMQEDTNIK